MKANALLLTLNVILRAVADMFGIPFRHLPIPSKEAGGKRVQEIEVTSHHAWHTIGQC